MSTKLIKVEDTYRLVDVTQHGNQLIGTTDLDYQKTWSDRCHKLSKQNCDEIFGVVDVEKLADEFAKTKSSHSQWLNTHKRDFKEGFNKAMELNKDKVFTLKDVETAMRIVFDWSEGDNHSECTSLNELLDKFQSLQQATEIEVEIKMEKTPVRMPGIMVFTKTPKFDPEGCLTLKKLEQ
jgi:hypothetical protein